MVKITDIPSTSKRATKSSVSVETGWYTNFSDIYIRSNAEAPVRGGFGDGYAVALTSDDALALVGAILEARAELLSKRAEMMENGNE